MNYKINHSQIAALGKQPWLHLFRHVHIELVDTLLYMST